MVSYINSIEIEKQSIKLTNQEINTMKNNKHTLILTTLIATEKMKNIIGVVYFLPKPNGKILKNLL